ncbi:MAG: ABC transporter transmembrane domain-containing protein [Candidatus Pacebacteria bacterium]|nr:ABC transporter transmembrane domain-containing protein [Candidatus Paceibacterota bacterium]
MAEQANLTDLPHDQPELDHQPLATGILVRRLYRDFVRPHWRRLLLALLMMVIIAGTTALLAKTVQPLLNDVFIGRNREQLVVVAVTIFILFLAKGIASYIEEVLMNSLGQTIVSTMQSAMFRTLVYADMAFFNRTATGLLIARLTNDVNLLRTVVTNSLTGMGKDFLSVVFLVTVMFMQDWKLSLVALVVFPAAILPIARQGRKMRKVSGQTQSRQGELVVRLEQVFQGNRLVKAYGMEAYETRSVNDLLGRILKQIKRAARVRALSSPIMETLGGIAIVTVVVIGGLQVIEGTRTTGTFFSFITALLLAYEPVKRLANLNNSLQEALAAAQRVFSVLDLQPHITSAAGAQPLVVQRGEIRIENLCFSYDAAPAATLVGAAAEPLVIPPADLLSDQPAPSGAPRRALDHFSLTIAPGQRVALVGKSGGGKSTLLNMIPRFYDPQEGRILIDGIDIRSVELRSLRRSLALVSQEVVLFDDTIRANIAYGDMTRSQAEIEQAAENAAAHEFIQALPQGYDTEVGEFGAKLSGGQRQRIAIARAMLRDAPILLLDEATSALDNQSERLVQQAMDRLMVGRTVVVIAHRLSTIIDADLICVIEGGKIVESGSHSELLARQQKYYALYRQYEEGEVA